MPWARKGLGHKDLGLGPPRIFASSCRQAGNCDRSDRSDPHDEFKGKNVLYIGKGQRAEAAEADEALGQARKR